MNSEMQKRKSHSNLNIVKLGLGVVILATGLSAQAQVTCRTLFEVPKSVTASISYTENKDFVSDLRSFKIVIKEIKKDRFLNKMFLDFNEKEKGITIETHVIDVFKQYLLESKRLVFNTRFLRVLPIAIALHDIGKPLAIEQGRRDLQHNFTIPLIRSYLNEKHWPEEDVNLVVDLVSYSGLGDLAKKTKTADVVVKELRILAANLRVPVSELYQAKRAFYFSDAGAYPQLRDFVFNELPDGRLEPKSERFVELEDLLSR